MTEIVQADRDAAATALEAIGSSAWHTSRARMIRNGEADDHPFVQAFARHRIASEQATVEAERERCALIADAEFRELTSCYQKPAGKDAMTAHSIAAAIRALPQSHKGE